MDNLIDSYTIKELCELEHLNYRTIKNRYEYIPIKIRTWQAKAQFKLWNQKKDYTIKYIRLNDILKLLENDIDFTFVRKKKKW